MESFHKSGEGFVKRCNQLLSSSSGFEINVTHELPPKRHFQRLFPSANQKQVDKTA